MSRDEIWFINKERKLWHRHLSKGTCAPARVAFKNQPRQIHWAIVYAKWHTQQCLYKLQNNLATELHHFRRQPHFETSTISLTYEGHAMYCRVSSTVIYILHRWGKPIKYNMMRVIAATYLILVDEEKHDRQNFQEEDEQEQDKELWRHKVESEDKWVIELIIYQYSTEGQQRRIIGVFMWRLNELDNKKERKPACLREK